MIRHLTIGKNRIVGTLFYGYVAPLELDNSGSVALEIMFIVLSFICRYGAECQKGEE